MNNQQFGFILCSIITVVILGIMAFNILLVKRSSLYVEEIPTKFINGSVGFTTGGRF